MPWTTNDAGERVHVPSLWVNDELPSFSEMYEMFLSYRVIIKNILFEDGDNIELIRSMDRKKHPYWNIDKRLCDLTMACNQMNKMVYENGFADRSIRFVLMIAYKGIDYYEDGLRREYVSDNVRNAAKLVKPITEDSIPPIYSIRHPEDKKNPFIKDPSSRIWISEETYSEMTRLHGNIHIYLRSADPIGEDSILDSRYGYDNIYPFFTETFQTVMAELYKPYKEYYEKERKIGGNKGCITGFDPAL